LRVETWRLRHRAVRKTSAASFYPAFFASSPNGAGGGVLNTGGRIPLDQIVDFRLPPSEEGARTKFLEVAKGRARYREVRFPLYRKRLRLRMPLASEIAPFSL
jgi:hypothetical protein